MCVERPVRPEFPDYLFLITMFSLTIMTQDISNYEKQEVFISVFVALENTKPLDYILRN